MKRILTLIAALCIVTGVSAQKAMEASDTLTNATTGYVSATIAGGYGQLSIHLNVVKVSGTVAGTAKLQGSNDGVNYATILPNDSLILANVATNTKLWDVGISPYLYYRCAITTTGTQVSIGRGYSLFRSAR